MDVQAQAKPQLTKPVVQRKRFQDSLGQMISFSRLTLNTKKYVERPL
jgi:hypothetical protein